MKNRISDKELLNFLERQSTYISIAKIADASDVSVKTVYRHVDSINQNSDENLIKSEKAKGYKLIKNFAFKKNKIDTSFSIETSLENRRKTSS